MGSLQSKTPAPVEQPTQAFLHVYEERRAVLRPVTLAKAMPID